MTFIPPEFKLPQDKVWVRDNDTGHESIWHIQDARHAMNVEPERYEVIGKSQFPAQAPIMGQVATEPAPGREDVDLRLNNRIDPNEPKRLPERIPPADGESPPVPIVPEPEVHEPGSGGVLNEHANENQEHHD